MDYANEQHLGSNPPLVLELQQQYHFMAQLASHVRNEEGNDAPNDYWGEGWSDDDDELEDDQQVHPTTHQEHINDDDDDDYYAKWSKHLGNTPSSTVQQEENNLVALQELTRLLHQSLPSASTSMTALNPLPKAVQHRYEWDEPNQ